MTQMVSALERYQGCLGGLVVAGAYHGINSIPTYWLEKLTLREFILDLTEKNYNKAWKLEN